MQSSSESEARTPRLFLSQNGACFMSPHLIPTDPGIDTPNKLPAAPHPSPVNMDIGQLNPESKEIFRAQLLKACFLKIPEAIENSTDEGVVANLSYTEAASPAVCKPTFTSLVREEIAKNICREDKVTKLPEVDGNEKFYYDKLEHDRDENSNFKKFPFSTEHCSSKFNYDFVKGEKGRSDLPRITFTIEKDEKKFPAQFDLNRCPAGNANQHEIAHSKNFRQEAEYNHHCEISAQNLNDSKFPIDDTYPDVTKFPIIKSEFVDTPPALKADILVSMKPMGDGKGQSYRLDSMSGQDRSVFFDSTTNRVDLSLLLDSNNEWDDSSSYRSRSPCSDKLSTIAQCASDASDISDTGEFEEDFGSSKDFGSSRDFESSKEMRSKSFGSSKEFSSKSLGSSKEFGSKSLGSSKEFGSKSLVSSKDFGSTQDCRPKKKASGNLVIRRFLRWRRCFKLRKKAESLDESQFPFLANRFDSYKTEFELSV